MANGPVDPSDEIRKKVDARLDELERQLNSGGLNNDEIAELERLTSSRFNVEENPGVRVIEEGINKLESMAESIKVDLPEPLEDSEFQSRLSKLHERADAVKRAREVQVKEQQKQRDSDAEAARGLGVGLSIAYTMIGLPLVGYGIGYFLDLKMGTITAKGTWGFGGVALAFVMVFVLLKRAEENEKK